MPQKRAQPIAQSPATRIPVGGLSARVTALADGFDGPPRQGMAVTTSTNDVIVLDILCQIAGEFADLSQADNHRLLQTAIVCGNELFRRAKAGDRDALMRLFQAATHTPILLDKLTPHQFEAIRSLARSNFSWPVVICLKPELLRRSLADLRRLGVGQLCSLNLRPTARWSAENPVTKWVMYLYDKVLYEWNLLMAVEAEGIEIDENMLDRWYRDIRSLPQLSKTTSDEWFDKALWPLLMRMTNDHPEQVKELRSFGRYRAGHTETAKPDSQTAEANIRDGIKAKLRQAFNSLARSAPTPAEL
jgi:hypothetical protein